MASKCYQRKMQKYIFNMKDILTYQVKKYYLFFLVIMPQVEHGLWCESHFVNCVCVCTVCVCMVNQDLSVFVLWTFWAQTNLFVTGHAILQIFKMHSWHLPTRCKQQHHHNTSLLTHTLDTLFVAIKISTVPSRILPLI